MVAVSRLCSLPPELLTKILLGLPAKSILVCKAVCKELYVVISSPSFIQEHFNRDSNLTRLVLYCDGVNVGESNGGRRNTRLSSYSYFPDETMERCEFPDNLLLGGEIIYLRGPCNGIFCLYTAENRFSLWNPTTRRLRLIRCSSSHKFDEMGFGVDPVTGDFKIVLIHTQSGISPSFAVYTSSNDSWKYMEQETLGDSEALIVTYSAGNNSFLNGFYCWIKHRKRAHSSLLAFDMHNETFQEIKIPEMISVGLTSQLHLFNDSFAIASFDGVMEVWVMEGVGQWKMLASAVLPFRCLVSYGFWGGNKILLSSYMDNAMVLMVYDLDSHRARQLRFQEGNDYFVSEFLPIYYKESLLAVKGEDGIQDYDARSAECLEFLGCDSHMPSTTINCIQLTAGSVTKGHEMFPYLF